ncbi:MAG: putative bifunctional diguanylate cyclase/phosphodiesterase, partial [Dehalococcoidia bacterium]
GLPNRNYFLSRLRASLDSAAERRRGEVGVLCLDLDRFKNVNDTLGHPVGDELLSVVAVRLASTVGEDHMVARLGGDEFTILMEQTSRAAVETMAGRVVEALRRSFHISGHDLFVTVSIGVALSGRGKDAATLDLLRQADIALYAAKAQGASRFVVYKAELDGRSPESLQLESGLAKAIENRELRVFYQPEVDLETGRLMGMEALVRWAHPVRGLVPPGQFIPLAEETGEIVRIGRWVLAQACADTVALGRRAGVALQVGVNVSAQELKRPDLVDYVSRVLARTGLPPHQLEMEITESGIIDNIEEARRTLSALRDLGVKLAIDDFGTGYSSLSYLHQLPLTTLKIDRSFVKDLGQKETPSAVTRAIVDVAGALGLEVVAEGIETREQLDFLRALSCQRGQGYLFARPMPRDEFAQLVWRRSDRDADTDLAQLVDPLAA